jgi:hypothetical protein
MSLSLGTAANAQIATGVAGAHLLIEMDFASPVGTQYATTAPLNLAIAGNTYIGLGNNVQVGMIQETEDTNVRQIVISAALVDQALLGMVLGDPSKYRNRAVRIYLQIFDENFAPVTSRVLRWSGRMEPVRVTRSQGGGRIEMPCSRGGLPYSRNSKGLRHTHAQQQQRFPGNMALQYLQDLVDKPSLWLSKRFQELQ